ncbi:unnamed protein product [Protopolystoma xenopodis]|uniref:Uncharacterized protein n=1 Tax=Protopolystoma xenopodis TaxID=117903 RepID=A0A3S5BPH1_9PLAT|nr:unnamed protein product [Protopolystoma xenopodis]
MGDTFRHSSQNDNLERFEEVEEEKGFQLPSKLKSQFQVMRSDHPATHRSYQIKL